MNWLDHVGSFFKKVLHIGVEVATIAEPVVAVAFPEVAPLYVSAIGLATAMQATAAAVPGTGPQKLAGLVQSLTPEIEAWTKKNGIEWNQADVSKWASALVETLKLIPAPTPSGATSASTPAS